MAECSTGCIRVSGLILNVSLNLSDCNITDLVLISVVIQVVDTTELLMLVYQNINFSLPCLVSFGLKS